MHKHNKAIFLDRDGVINEDNMYPHKIEDFSLLPNVIEGLKELKKCGFIFIIITNQSGIGRGIYSEEDMHAFNKHLLSVLKKEGIWIKKIFYCPHHPEENCACRKPNTKMIDDAAKEFNIDIQESYVLGDHKSDIDIGKKLPLKTVFMMTGHGPKDYDPEMKADFIARDMMGAAEWISQEERKKKTTRKIISMDDLDELSLSLKKKGRKIVTINGSFDIMHLGHIKILEEAKEQGDILIVGLNSDDSIKRYKPKGRPINDEKTRKEFISAIGYVDYVVVFDDTTPLEFIKKASPNIHCNGEEYGKDCIESSLLKKIGARLHLIKKHGDYSTTELIKKIRGLR